MRSFGVIAVAAVCVLVLASAGTSATKPTLKVGLSPQLSLIGAGFKPRVLVTLRIVSTGVSRRVTLRTGSRGGFTYRIPSFDRCEPLSVVASAANGVSARVPVGWFTRSCIAPPPIEPGLPPQP